MSGFRVFSIGDIPVFVSPIFLLIILLWMGTGDVAAGLVFGAVVTVSILVHELGHAVIARHFRLQPSILLHGLGGLCFHAPAQRPRDEALIIAAGPGAGLLLGVLTLMFGDQVVEALSLHGRTADLIIINLLYVNFFWSFVNLLPLWPLDGGQLFRLLMQRLVRPGRAEKVTHGVGLAFSMVFMIGGWFMMHSVLMVMLGMWLALDNYRGFQGEAVVEPVRQDNDFAKELVEQAMAAHAAGDYGESVRLCQQVRAETHVPESAMKRVWALLGVGTARLGRHEEAMSYLRRAPVNAETVEARVECLHQMDDAETLQVLVRSPDFKKIDAERRKEILAVLNEGR